MVEWLPADYHLIGTVSAISNVIDASSSDGAFFVLMNVLYIGIMLSANLGIMNLLPIPGLDGGRLLLYLIEAIKSIRNEYLPIFRDILAI